MIYRMSKDLAENLQARKFPVHVYYGPERLTRHGVASFSVVISRDRERGDLTGPARGVQGNPKKWGERRLGCVAMLWASAPCDGARVSEHEHECDALADALIIELWKWGSAARAGEIPITEARYLTPDEVAETELAEQSNGVVYMIRFQVPRAILERDYTGAAHPVGSLTAVTTTEQVSLDGTHYEQVI